MTARDRYVVGSWLLLAGVVFAAVGFVAWSHVDTRHLLVQPAATNCLIATPVLGSVAQSAGHATIVFESPPHASSCPGSTPRVIGYRTTSNHLPGLALLVCAAILGLAGVYFMRSESAPELA